MRINPASYVPAVSLGVGGGATAAMAAADDRTASQIRMGTTIFGTAYGVSRMGGALMANDFGPPAAMKWANSPARLTGMSKAGQAALTGTAILGGVLVANAAAAMVLDVKFGSLAKS